MQAFFIKLLLTRLLIGVVIFVNLLCAASFLIAPGLYTPGFELVSPMGDAAIRGFGVLFLMWNVPYLVAFTQPVHNRTAHLESIAMQTIGLLGESYIYQSIPGIHETARSSIGRFIIFDLLGLAALLLALYFVPKNKPQNMLEDTQDSS